MMDSSQYKKQIQEIKDYASKNGISQDEVNTVFKECFHLFEAKTSSKIKTALKLLKIFSIIFLAIFFSILILYNHPKTHNVFLRNLQNFIYPGLRIFRKLAVPIITLYPSLTVWYDEWCIVENPYFRVNEMDCWPCSSVSSIQDLTDYNLTSMFNIGVPFTRVEKTKNVDMDILKQIYMKHEDTFNTGTEQVLSNHAYYRTIHDVMYKRFNEQSLLNEDVHVRWRINHMETSRKLREIFPKLSGIPDWWSPSTEKFIFIDEPKAAAYSLPNPECANIILECTNGERIIELNPSPECKQNCQKLKILLTTHQSLWYNWWYWRPVSLPSDNTTAVTIMYLTSYC